MMTLRSRLTLSYTAFAALPLVALALILTRLWFAFAAQPTVNAVWRAVASAELIVATHPGESARTLDPALRRLSGNGVVVMLPPPDLPLRGGRRGEDIAAIRAYSLTTLLGLRERRVAIPGSAPILIAPDLRRLVPALRLYLVLVGLSVAAAVALAWIIAHWLTRQAIAPLTTVTAELRRFAGGDLTPRRLTSSDRAELGALTAAFNGAATQVAAALDERIRVEEQMRRFVADAGHELRTPLTAIGGFVDLLERGAIRDPQTRERAFATLRAETLRMRRLVERLMTLARLERPEAAVLETVDVAEIAAGAVEEAVAARRGDVRLVRPDASLLALAEPGELHEAIRNLVDNALKYGAGSPIAVALRRDGDQVELRVTDGGPGIPAAERPHVFERFFRGEQTAGIEGSGLGLAIAERAARRCGGSVRLDERGTPGTTFVLRLPGRPARVRLEPLQVG
jgi:two-component system, OmpR family, sensor kinase